MEVTMMAARASPSTGFSVRYGLLDPPDGIDLMLLAPRLPDQYVRGRFVDGWIVRSAPSRDVKSVARSRPQRSVAFV
jgi:ketol-acid reductoisomerase